MRTFTKPADVTDVARAATEVRYETRFGVGRLWLTGDLPVELELPGPRLDPGSADGLRASARVWRDRLERYFGGEAVDLSVDVDRLTAMWGCTVFEAGVFRALAAVPYGHAVSYRDLAVAAGYPDAYRAAGSVMARNPLPVILPCHRVIRNDGRLGDYGDDPRWKARLLALEGYTVLGTTDQEV